jgi:flagellar hook-length control protein FliK
MSAINPVIQTPPRLNPDQFNSDTGQTGAPAAQQGFSDTLDSVSARPVRKSTSNRGQHSDGSGDNLPATGNSSPQPVTQAGPNPTNTNASTGANAPASANATAATTPAATSANTQATDATAASTAGASPAAGAAVGNGKGASAGAAPATAATSAAAAAAAALDQTSPPGSLPGQIDEVPQSADTSPTVPSAAAAPTAAGTQPLDAAATAAASATAASQSPAVKDAAKPTSSAPSNWIAGRNAIAMRAINPTGDSANVTAGKSTAGGQDPSSVPALDTSSAATVPAAQVDTAAMIGAMQASSPVSTAAADNSAPALPAGSPSNPIAGASGLTAGNSEVASALPALAAAAASTAQVVSTIAAGVAADKKSQADSTDGANASTADAAGAAQLLNTQGTPHAETNAVPTFRVNAPVDSPDFSQNVANHVSTMFDSNVNSAKLQVNPAALGPIEVRISIQGDHAQVWMASHSAMTRDALQEAAPKLREMLNSQGFAQVSVDISQRSFQERAPTAHAYEWNSESSGASSAAPRGAASVTSRVPSGMLDAYA